MNYKRFLKQKAIVHEPVGFKPEASMDSLFDWQREVVTWGCHRGRAALFEDCGLGKSIQQLTWANEVTKHGPVLLLTPLAVAGQMHREAKKFGIESKIVTEQAECTKGINITNYEKLHRFDPSYFKGVSLDESSILKSFDGKYRSMLIDAFRRTPHRMACTATPAPNDYMELGNHAEFLGIMSRVEMLSMFFVHDGGETQKWRLKGHAEELFWKWLCSWAVCLRKPSDIGYSDDGFNLPELNFHEHLIETNKTMDGFLIPMPASTLQERRNARKVSLEDRVAKTAEIANAIDDSVLVWCGYNDESDALTKAIDGAVEVKGSDSDEHKESAMLGFADGTVKKLVTKGSICGFGMNWQHCNQMIFAGVSDSYEQYYQGIRRCWRFGQKRPVNVHIVASDLESAVLRNLKRKESDADRMANEMVKHMAEIFRGEAKQSIRETIAYTPKQKMKLPEWIAA